MGIKNWKTITGEATKRLRGDKKLMLLVAVGFLGIFLLLLSELWKPKENPENPSSTEAEGQHGSDYTYAEDMEKRLTELLAAMRGVGRVKVMVTLENGLEQVYAENERRKAASNSPPGSGGENVDENYEYILIRTDSGAEDGLILKVIQPKIRGVAVVCEGGDSAAVRQEVLAAVTAVLHISSTRVSVSKME